MGKGKPATKKRKRQDHAGEGGSSGAREGNCLEEEPEQNQNQNPPSTATGLSTANAPALHLQQPPLSRSSVQTNEEEQTASTLPIERGIQNAQPDSVATSNAEANVNIGHETDAITQPDRSSYETYSEACGRDEEEEPGLLLENGKRCPWSVRWRNPELMTQDECLKAHEDFTNVINDCYDVLVSADEVDEEQVKKWTCNFRVIMVSLHLLLW